MSSLFQELKRRKVFRVAALYAVVAWVLIQVADTVLPALQMPEWTISFVTVLFILGFLPTLIAAWAFEITPDGIKPDIGVQTTQVAASNNTDRKLIYATFALVLLVAGFQLSDRLLAGNSLSSSRSTESASINTNTSVMRSSINLNHPLLQLGVGLRTIIDISADGAFLAYANIGQGYWMLRNLATQETRVLEGTRVNGKAKFSPNGQMILLIAADTGVVGIQPVQGGLFQPIPSAGGNSATWLSDEQVIYQHTDGDTRILTLADRTETIVPNLGAAAGDGSNGYYVFNSLPSGSAFLYKQKPSAGQPGESVIQAYDLNDQSNTLITSNGFYPQYVYSGHVLFLRDGDLWAVPFDAENLRVTGAEARVLQEVDQAAPIWGAYSVSDTGRLVYLPKSVDLSNQTTLYSTDRLGARSEISLPAGIYGEPRLSPNGELLALTSFQQDGGSDVWILQFSSGTFRPLTFSGNARSPVWTPDGSQVVYMLGGLGFSDQSPRGELWIRNANGTGQAERILDGGGKPDSFSPNGEELIYFSNGFGSGALNLSTLSKRDDAWISEPLFHTDYNAWGARISPDGRWIAYGSAESGTLQIYVQPYPNIEGGKWQISAEETAAREPSWGPNSDELFYLRTDGTMMRAALTIQEDSIVSALPQPLFTGVQTLGSSPLYALSSDGERIFHLLPTTRDGQSINFGSDLAELYVVENFFEELRRLAPPDSQ